MKELDKKVNVIKKNVNSRRISKVIQSNDLIEAFYETDLTATEHKVIRYAASKIADEPDSFPVVSFTISEFIKAAGIKGNGYHQRIIEVADNLSTRRIKIQNYEKIGWFPWVAAISYERGTVEITFNSLLKKHILGLEREYTPYDFPYIGDMQSAYSIRLFELLRQYAFIGKRRISLEVLKKRLGIHDKYSRYSHFKQRVIEQAKKELDERNMLQFTYEEIKKGRKVDELVFYIKMNDTPAAIEAVASIDPEELSEFLKEAKPLLKSYHHNVDDKDLKKWAPYGIDLLKSVLKETFGREISNSYKYISKVLASKKEKLTESTRNIKCEDLAAKMKTAEFILSNMYEISTPDWFIEDKFYKYMSNHGFTDEQTKKIWEDNGKYIEEKAKAGE